MRNVYLDPFSSDFLSNRIFSRDPALNRDDCLEIWRYLKEYCSKHGIELNTADYWTKESAADTDVYAALNHNERSLVKEIYARLKGRKTVPPLKEFNRKVLLQFETPVVQPWPHGHIKELSRMYDSLFFSWKSPETADHGYIHYPDPFRGIMEKHWRNTERSFLTMINTNKRFFSPPTELHTKRIEATIFFGKLGELDLYGRGWDKPVGNATGWESVRKAYKGSVVSKYETLSRYTFALCFENMALPGYITEKIIDCLYVGTIPVYWGAQDIEEYVPKECFIDMREFKDYGELRSHLKSMTRDEIAGKRQAAKEYLVSDLFSQFTKEYFAELFVDAVNGVPRKS